VEKEVHARVRALARYMQPGAHNALADGLVLEQRLRGRIQVSAGFSEQGLGLQQRLLGWKYVKVGSKLIAATKC
jgi:hypothetical protein